MPRGKGGSEELEPDSDTADRLGGDVQPSHWAGTRPGPPLSSTSAPSASSSSPAHDAEMDALLRTLGYSGDEVAAVHLRECEREPSTSSSGAGGGDNALGGTWPPGNRHHALPCQPAGLLGLGGLQPFRKSTQREKDAEQADPFDPRSRWGERLRAPLPPLLHHALPSRSVAKDTEDAVIRSALKQAGLAGRQVADVLVGLGLARADDVKGTGKSSKPAEAAAAAGAAAAADGQQPQGQRQAGAALRAAGLYRRMMQELEHPAGGASCHPENKNENENESAIDEGALVEGLLGVAEAAESSDCSWVLAASSGDNADGGDGAAAAGSRLGSSASFAEPRSDSEAPSTEIGSSNRAAAGHASTPGARTAPTCAAARLSVCRAARGREAQRLYAGSLLRRCDGDGAAAALAALLAVDNGLGMQLGEAVREGPETVRAWLASGLVHGWPWVGPDGEAVSAWALAREEALEEAAAAAHSREVAAGDGIGSHPREGEGEGTSGARGVRARVGARPGLAAVVEHVRCAPERRLRALHRSAMTVAALAAASRRPRTEPAMHR